jgi:hypothetical protein
MSAHLPECLTGEPSIHGTYTCICERLRACEKRVTRSKERVIQEAEHYRSKGYAEGLSAARDAVDNWPDAANAVDLLRGGR